MNYKLVGVNGKARKITKGYVGVNGKARKIIKVYMGVNGKARKIRTGFKTTEIEMNLNINNRGTAIAGNYLLLAGGMETESTDASHWSLTLHKDVTAVDLTDTSGTYPSLRIDDLDEASRCLSSITDKNQNAIFLAGLNQSTSPGASRYGYIYSSELVKTSFYLDLYRRGAVSGKAGNKLLFFGGMVEEAAATSQDHARLIEVFDEDTLTRETGTAMLPDPYYGLISTNVEDKCFFTYGRKYGYIKSGNKYVITELGYNHAVFEIDKDLTVSQIEEYSDYFGYNRVYPAFGSINLETAGPSAVLIGGQSVAVSGTSYDGISEVFTYDGTRLVYPSLTKERDFVVATNLNDDLIISGGHYLDWSISSGTYVQSTITDGMTNQGTIYRADMITYGSKPLYNRLNYTTPYIVNEQVIMKFFLAYKNELLLSNKQEDESDTIITGMKPKYLVINESSFSI